MKVLVIHHHDRDGIVAASVVYKMLECAYNIIDFASVGHQGPLSTLVPEGEYDAYYLVDYAISTHQNAGYIVDLVSEGKEVIWIDHHESSPKFMKKHPEYQLDRLKGYRVIGISGAALTWMWFNKCRLNLLSELYRNTFVAANNTTDEITHNCATDILREMKCPLHILYTHWYDIWDLREDVLAFSYGYCPTDPRSATDEFDRCTGVDCEAHKTKCILNKYIETGRICMEYQNDKDRNVAAEIGFKVDIAITHNGETHHKSAFAMNRVFGNSQAFGDKMDEYDICIPFYFNGSGFTYSMYTKKSDINCATLCEALGGGGHPQAAGFRTDTLIFEMGNRTIDIDL